MLKLHSTHSLEFRCVHQRLSILREGYLIVFTFSYLRLHRLLRSLSTPLSTVCRVFGGSRSPSLGNHASNNSSRNYVFPLSIRFPLRHLDDIGFLRSSSQDR